MAGEQQRPRRKAPAGLGGNATSGTGASERVARSSVAKDGSASGRAQNQGEVIASLEAAVAAITSERDRLIAELSVAHARIGDLEARNTQALDRLNWVIESLQTALED